MDSFELRKAGPNEKRCIIRHAFGFYSNIAVGCIYSFPHRLVSESELNQPGLYAPALVECINKHPLLSATIDNAGTNDPVYTKPQQINLKHHTLLVETASLGVHDSSAEQKLDESVILQRLFEQIHNEPSFRFSSADSQPCWSIVVLPLPNQDDSTVTRVFICFVYSHSHGDGMSGLAFHDTFHSALQKSISDTQSSRVMTINAPQLPFPVQPDTSSSIPITISYLIRPALGTYLPRFLTRLLGISGNASGADDTTWTGAKTFVDTRTPGLKATTSIELLTINAQTISKVTTVCRNHNTKLTPLLNHLISHALGSILPKLHPQSTNFVSTTPINLRRALHTPLDTIGNYSGAAYLHYPIPSGSSSLSITEHTWSCLHTQAKQLAHVASTTKNQPIGLLRFITNFPSWLGSQIGQVRDSSWELSNLGLVDFHPASTKAEEDQTSVSVEVEGVLFSQPASAMGPPLCFNAVTSRRGGLNVVVSWQGGALGLEGQGESGTGGDGDGHVLLEVEERKCVRSVLDLLSHAVEVVAGM